jgi:C-terminal processing protease CtpA/Prc
MGGGDQPDLTIDARTRATVVESLAVKVRDHYVFPEQATKVARDLKRRLTRKEYDSITSAKEFADSLTAHMQAITHDLHLRAHYRHDPIPAQRDDGPPPAEEIRRRRELERARNYGFEKVERLAGNVGYLEMFMFSRDPEAQPTAVAAMNFLGNVDALIIDLRRNGGGSPAMIQTLLTYLIAPEDRILFNTFFQRGEERIEQWHTASHVPGPRLNGKPIYVLISPLTGSAAEEFAYDIQTHQLGTLVGATTAGAANPGGFFRLDDHFGAFVATGRAINPITNTNWEGVGVKPDVAVPPETALRAAHVAALEKLIERAEGDAQRAALNGALERAKERTDDAPESFMRRQRRAS